MLLRTGRIQQRQGAPRGYQKQSPHHCTQQRVRRRSRQFEGLLFDISQYTCPVASQPLLLWAGRYFQTKRKTQPSKLRQGACESWVCPTRAYPAVMKQIVLNSHRLSLNPLMHQSIKAIKKSSPNRPFRKTKTEYHHQSCCYPRPHFRL